MSLQLQTTSLLVELEHTLRASRLWSDTMPPQEALLSQAPFACDSMAFEQWLQFIFMPRMMVLIDSQQPLPDEIALLPMAEQVYSGQAGLSQLFAVLKNIDLLLGGQTDLAQDE